MKRIGYGFLLGILAFAVTACGGGGSDGALGVGGGGSGGNPVISVSISPPTASLLVGGTQQFTATVAGSANQSVTWSIQQGSAGGTITTGGLYTAPNTPGTYHVIATSQADSGKSASATVTVSPGTSLTTWEKTYPGANWEIGNSVKQTSDGGYVIAGYGTQTDPRLFPYSYFSDALLIKTDPAGNVVFKKYFGGTGMSEMEAANSVQQTSDGGYVIAGRITDGVSSSIWDIYLLKTNSAGNEIWHKAIDVSLFDYGYSVVQVSDGGYVIAGTNFNAGVTLVKTGPDGTPTWAKNLGGGIGYSVQQTSDGGYVIAGTTIGIGAVYLVKTDSNGIPLWTKTLPGADEGQSIQQTSDGGYVIAGWSYAGIAAGDDVSLIKTDPSGNQIWIKNYGGNGNERGFSVQQTTDGGYIIAGATNSIISNGGFDVFLIKADSAGEPVWTRTFGGVGDDLGYSVRQTSDGGYIIVGETYNFGAVNSDVYLIKVDTNGNVK